MIYEENVQGFYILCNLPEMKIQKWNALPANAQCASVSTKNHQRWVLFTKQGRTRLLEVTDTDTNVSSDSKDNLDISL